MWSWLRVVVLVFVSVTVPGFAEAHNLTFAERVDAQRAIEDVYYSHRDGTSQTFDVAVPQEMLEDKVRDYLRRSVALEHIWNKPVTAAALEQEMARIARSTRFPERLLEVYSALKNDPVLIQECLARASLVRRQTRKLFDGDEAIHAAARQRAEDLRGRLVRKEIAIDSLQADRTVLKLRDLPTDREGSSQTADNTVPDTLVVPQPIFRRLREIAPKRIGEIGPVIASRKAFRFYVVLSESHGSASIASVTIQRRPWEHWWAEITPKLDWQQVKTIASEDTYLPMPVSSSHEAVTESGDSVNSAARSGSSIYDWQPLSTEDAPQERYLHTAVWTGSELIVWGGFQAINSYESLSTGGRYDPLIDDWQPVSDQNAPDERRNHTAVWTGSEMVIWGGSPALPSLGGGRYDPVTDTWLSVSTVGEPSARQDHSAVWTGSEMIIWGGSDLDYESLGDGSRYNPATDTWVATSQLDAPAARHEHTAVWTGNEMIVWGGYGSSTGSFFESGSRYDPLTDAWTTMSQVDAPVGRRSHTAVWTGSEMIVWGGYNPPISASGGRYSPAADTWTAISVSCGPPSVSGHTAVWTGSEMIISWSSILEARLRGWRYDPLTNTWTATSDEGAPTARYRHSAVWTGNEMIVWGGRNGVSTLKTGGAYIPGQSDESCGIIPEISTLAAQLNHDPLGIYEHVRNNFRFELYFGHLKGHQATLETRGGNDYDLAALTAELLKASGFNVRYGRGTAIIPSQAIIEWLGLEDAAAANPILNTAGIEAVPVLSGSEIDHYRVDRFWVEVEAALGHSGELVWLPLDTAFKRHDLEPGIPGLFSAVAFDEDDYLSVTRPELAYEYYSQQMRDYLDLTLPGTALGDVPLGMTLDSENLGQLPKSLPYRLSSSYVTYPEIPDSLSHSVTVRFDYGFDEPPWIERTLAIPDTSLRRLTVSCIVDPDDQAIVDSYGGLASTPPGAVDVFPQLKLNGVPIMQGESIPYLALFPLEIDFEKPEGGQFDGTSQHALAAGELAAIGIDAFQISETHLQRQAQTVVDAVNLQESGGTPDQDDLVGALLYLAIMQFHADARTGDDTLAALSHFKSVRGVSQGIAYSNQEVFSVDGIPFTALPGNLLLDVRRLPRWRFALNDDNLLEPELRRLSGFNTSAQEHALWEGLINMPSMSTIKSLQIANETTPVPIPIFVIDDTDGDPNNNCSVLCPQLNLDSQIKEWIEDSVQDEGHVVTVPRDETPLNEWTGVGFIEEDPITGGMAYYIWGGVNVAAEESWSEPLQPDLESGGAVTVILEDGTVLVVPSGQLGDAQGQSFAGDPVNIANGNFFRQEVDFSIPALEEPLSFRRYYNSQSTFDRALGRGWTHQYSDVLVPQPDGSVVWIDKRGTAYTFQAGANPGEFISPPGLRETLTLDLNDVASTDEYGPSLGWNLPFTNPSNAFSNEDTYSHAVPPRLGGNAGHEWSFGTASDTRIGHAKVVIESDHIANLASGYMEVHYKLAPSTEWQEIASIWYNQNNPIPKQTVLSANLGEIDLKDLTIRATGWNNAILGQHELRAYVALFQEHVEYRLRRFDGRVQLFDPHGRLLSRTDRNGNAFTFAYDELGRLTSVTDPASRSLTFTYTAANRIETVSDFTGRTWTYAYDIDDRLEQVASPSDAQTLAMITRYSYGDNGRMATITEPNGGVRQLNYYANGRVSETIDPLGNITSLVYNPFKWETRVTNERGVTSVYGFNEHGNLTTLTHPDGTVDRWEYEDNRVTSQTDPLGNTETFEYYADGSLERAVDATNIETRYEYEPPYSNLTKITRPGGRESVLHYDANGNLDEFTDGAGHLWTAIHNTEGLPESVTDGRDATTTYDFNEAGQWTSRSTELPSTESRDYFPRGTLEEITDANDHPHNFTFDLLDRVTTETDAEGNTTSYTYDEAGRLETITDPRTHTTTFEYDLNNRLVRRVAADGSSIHFEYDEVGNVVAETDELGRVTRAGYDERNRLVQLETPDGARTGIGYDGASRITTITDPLGNTTSFEYDDAGRLTGAIDATGNRSEWTYDPNGNQETYLDRRGGLTTYEYDALNRITEIRAPEDRISTADYDENGNLEEIAQYDVLGLGEIPDDPRTLPPDRKRVRTNAYDVLNRLESITDPEGHMIRFEYDDVGNVRYAWDERSNMTEAEYDDANRMTKLIRPDLGEVQIEYDTAGNRTDLQTPRGGTYSWDYDERNRLISATDPLGRVTSLDYDLAGNVARRGNHDGSWITATYDPMDRLVHLRRSDGTFTSRAYDAAGNVIRATTDRTALELRYNTLNRLFSETLTFLDDGFSRMIGYEYDEEGALNLITDPEGRSIDYDRDTAGRIYSITTDPGGPTATISYNGYSERETLSYGNGTSGVLDYDKNGRILQIDWTNPIASLTYIRDAAGNPETINEVVAGVTETLTTAHDVFNRPTAVSAAYSPGTRSESFAYDLNDNLTDPGDGSTSTFNVADQLLTGASGEYSYDAQGNRIAVDDGVTRLETLHDPSNRITAIRKFVNGVPDHEVTFTRDGLGRLAEVRSGSSVRRVVHAFSNRLLEYDGIGSPTVLYMMTDGVDDVMAAVMGGTTQYLHRDSVNSVRAVTGDSGSVLGWRHYGLFGRRLASSGAPDLPVGFTCRPLDDSTGLIDLRARFFDPGSGAFLSRDPVGFPALAPNPHTYAANRPLVFFDLLGRSPISPEIGLRSDLLGSGPVLLDSGFNPFAVSTSALANTQSDDRIPFTLFGIEIPWVFESPPRLLRDPGELLGIELGMHPSAAVGGVDIGPLHNIGGTIGTVHPEYGFVPTNIAIADVPVGPARLGQALRGVQSFRSFPTLKRTLGPAGEGKVWHHIVEQRRINILRFGEETIHSTRNVVPVPAQVNQAIANYYSRVRPFTKGQTVRGWLTTQSFSEQTAFGKRIMELVIRGKALP